MIAAKEIFSTPSPPPNPRDNDGCVAIGCLMIIICPLLVVGVVICLPLLHHIFKWWLG